MPTVRFPNVMKYYVNNQSEFFVPAASVQELVDQVVVQYPAVAEPDRLFDDMQKMGVQVNTSIR